MDARSISCMAHPSFYRKVLIGLQESQTPGGHYGLPILRDYSESLRLIGAKRGDFMTPVCTPNLLRQWGVGTKPPAEIVEKMITTAYEGKSPFPMLTFPEEIR